jgi:uncharacterized phage protein (TIGR01671 family)
MREIKFRVWDVEDKVYCYFDDLEFYTGDSESKMLDGIPVYVGKLHSRSRFSYKKGKHTSPIYQNFSEKNRYVIQQSTRVKDKNGKEIYEGDIVEYKFPNGSKMNGVVSWIAGMFVLDFPDQTDSGPIGFLWTADVEVIGNIHQNPELVK